MQIFSSLGSRPAAKSMKKPAAKKKPKKEAPADDEEAEEEDDASEKEDFLAKDPSKDDAEELAAGSAHDDEDEGPIPTTLFKGKWTVIRRNMILARLPKIAQPIGDIGESKSYTLANPLRKAKIQVNLTKPQYYVKGAEKETVENLSLAFGTKFKMDNCGGVGVASRLDPYGSFTHAMAIAEWKLEDLQ